MMSNQDSLVGWRILSAVDQVQPGKYAKTRAKNWKCDYSFEFLMLEMMAQTGGLIVGAVRDFTGNVVFAKVESASFSTEYRVPSARGNEVVRDTRYAVPLVIEAFANDGVSDQGSWIDAHILRRESEMVTDPAVIPAQAGIQSSILDPRLREDDNEGIHKQFQKVASARFFLIDAGDLSGNGKSLTFHKEFLEYYKIREKIISL